MIDIAVLRANPEAVKENMIKKFQHSKLPLVDEILLVDKQCREFVTKGSELRGRKNELSKQIGVFFKNKEIDKANEAKAEIASIDGQLKEYDGKIAIFRNEDTQPLNIYDSYVSVLPQSDQEKLKSGITVSNTDDLQKVIEDYTS